MKPPLAAIARSNSRIDFQRAARIELQPVAEDRRRGAGAAVANAWSCYSRISSIGRNFVNDRSRMTLALFFGNTPTCSSSVKKRRLGLPDLLLLRELALGAEDVAALGAPVRMAIEYLHGVLTRAD